MSDIYTKDISNDSVFDWGLKSLGSISPLQRAKPTLSFNNRRGAAADGEEPSSRYDPKAMTRIVDITDLVEEILSDADIVDDDVAAACERSESFASVGASSSTQSNKQTKRRPHYGLLVSLAGMIIAASLAIGYAVVNRGGNNPFSSSNNINDNDRGSTNSVRGSTNEQQLLLEMAERITIACSEDSLERDGVYRSECNMLCHENLCCFEESDEYPCEDSESMACAVYAGCQALVNGVPVGEAEEEAE